MHDKPIDSEKTVDMIKDKPYNLPAGFVWSEIDMKDKDQVHEVYELLTQNYVEDDDNMFRFDYSV
jgi:glycylpeptide N-tetradecanoyltransferase